MSTRSDRELGLFQDISRREFIGNVAAGVGAVGFLNACALHAPPQLHAGLERARYYPPRIMGMRGDHEGAFESAHRLRSNAPVFEAFKYAC